MDYILSCSVETCNLASHPSSKLPYGPPYDIIQDSIPGPHRRWDAGNPAKGFAGIHFPEIQPMKRGPRKTVWFCGKVYDPQDSIPGPHRRWDAGNPAKGFAGIHFPEIQPMKRGPRKTVWFCGKVYDPQDSIPGPHRRWDAGNPAKGFCGDSRTARKRAQKARNGFRGYSRGKNRGKGLSCRAMLRRAGEWL